MPRDDFGKKFADGGGYYLTPCISCERKHIGYPTCDAFPRGIPMAILEGKFQHKTVYPGDGGLTYKRDVARWKRLQPFLQRAKPPFGEPLPPV